jgi:hypothetical protein
MIPEEQIGNLQQFAHSKKEMAFTHSIYSYPAKFTSYLPRELIKVFTKKGDLICDPFSGGGTIGLESMLLDRHFIGYDINPFAIFLSKVKTTFISEQTLKKAYDHILHLQSVKRDLTVDILDKIDKICLGTKISDEINRLNQHINTEIIEEHTKNFFKLALIHSIKIVGRRDFEDRINWKKASILPVFENKVKKMIKKVSSLPEQSKMKPDFRNGSNHNMKIGESTVDCIITSPPYLEVDIEYQKIQLQRPSLNKSKRSNVVNQILGVPNLSKRELCWTGKNGSTYWNNLRKSLLAIRRILKDGKYLCFWTGFKRNQDEDSLMYLFSDINLELKARLPIRISDNRAASSRSTHHSRKTGMLRNDTLYFLRKEE